MRERQTALKSIGGDLGSWSELICCFVITSDMAQRAAFCKDPTSKLDTPWDHDVRECVAPLEDTVFEADYGVRQLDNLELLTALPG